MPGTISAGPVPAVLSSSEKADDDYDDYGDNDIPLTDRRGSDAEHHPRPAMDTDDERMHGSTEATPFITAAPPPSSGHDEDPRDRLRWRVIVYSFAIVFLVEVALNVCWPAWNAMLERGLCAEMHPDLGVVVAAAGGEDTLDPRCKEADVQGRLAMYRGWSYTIDALPSMFYFPVFVSCPSPGCVHRETGSCCAAKDEEMMDLG